MLTTTLALVVLFGGRPAIVKPAPSKPGLAALNVKTLRGVDKELGVVVSDSLLVALKTGHQFSRIIGASDMADTINLNKQKQVLGCADDGCLAELAGALGVPYLLAGNLSLVGGHYLISLKILDVEKAHDAARVSGTYPNELSLVEGLPALTKALLSRLRMTVSKPEPSVKRWLVGGTVALGAALTGVGWFSFRTAQRTYDEEPSIETSDALASASETGNRMAIAGAVAAAVSVALWGLTQ